MNTDAIKTVATPASGRAVRWFIAAIVVAAVGAAAFFTRERWQPPAERLYQLVMNPSENSDDHAVHDDHPPDGDAHAGHENSTSLELSPQAMKNIGLTTAKIKLEPFERTLSVPGIIVGQPGRSQVEVTAPMGGRVTRVYAIKGETVVPGRPLFDLRLTHEDLVTAQSNLLRSAEQLDVELREIERLQAVVDSGLVPGTRLLERKYEKQKIEAEINTQRQSLLLHGLTKEQIDGIIEDRQLVQGITVVVPDHPANGQEDAADRPFTVRSLDVKPGKYVEAGAPMCSLVDYAVLYIEGRAFERDADALLKAAREQWPVSAINPDDGKRAAVIAGLEIAYVDSEVDPESRVLTFYVDLPNEIIHESKSAAGQRFLNWRYKPGQRMQVRVPVEKWSQRIVLPVGAIAKEGVEFYVFKQNGDHFDRIPVQVEHQDQVWTVIANDGSLFSGDTVATRGAYELQVALKNKSGGGVDPHAGHSH